MVTKKQYIAAQKLIADYEQQLRERNVIASPLCWQFMFTTDDEWYLKPEPKWQFRYLKAKSLDEAVQKFIARQPKHIVRLDYEVRQGDTFHDISNVDAVQDWL